MDNFSGKSLEIHKEFMPKASYTRGYPHYPQEKQLLKSNFTNNKKELMFCEFIIKIVNFKIIA